MIDDTVIMEIFHEGEAGSCCYCSPGAIVAANGDVLLFCEARIEHHDFSPHHITYKRSGDGGKTWGECRHFEESRNGECYMNPTPVVDAKTGRLFLFYALADMMLTTRVFYRYSDDHGHTWSGRTEMNSLFQADPYARVYHLPGPGHGIQHSSGRLLVQVWHRKAIRWEPQEGKKDPFDIPADQREYGDSVIYSDDGGETWRNGGYLAVFSPDGNVYRMNESRLVERNDRSILIWARPGNSQDPYRVKAVSDDRGVSWSEPFYERAVGPVVSCDGGLVKVNENCVLLSRPDHPNQRECLTVYASPDDTKTWPYSRVIDPGHACYNDMTVLPDGNVMVFYESGYYSHSRGKAVSGARFSPEWVKGK